MLIFENSA
jgi:hypothetical protein